tara:strand:+ start:410 stop:1042 length:633 start_codon:yes stop_codon:yes gene_type:complete
MNSIVSEKRYISERLGIPYENLSQSYLRAETKLATTSKIDFTLQRNKAVSAFVTERLLDLNDEFVITHFFVGLRAATNDTDEQQLKSVVNTYESTAVYSNTNVGVVYNSNLNFTIDRTEFIPQFPVRAFRRVPFQQMDVNSLNGAMDGKNGFTNGLYGFANSEPTLINGRQTIDLSIDLDSSVVINDQAATGLNIYAVFEARGYLVVNAK